MEAAQKIKKRVTRQFSNLNSGYIYDRTQNGLSKRYLHIHDHWQIIHKSQEVEATSMSTDRWMDKENMVYTQNGILFSLKNKENPMEAT